jgi:DNA-binding response OmpR family regulator
MLTAKDEPVNKEKAMTLGVVAFIVKLFDLDELKHTVREVLEPV